MAEDPMKVLVSAYACEPDCGSEPAIGWNLVCGLSRDHQLTVMTRANNRARILACGEPWVASVNWIFLDPPRWLTFWKKGRSGVRLFYLIWQWLAFLKGRDLLRQDHYDLVHHLTFASVLPASPLAFLGKPFVAGPLGGAQEAPTSLVASLPWRSKIAVRRQKWIRKAMGILSLARVAYGRSRYCLGATEEAVQVLRGLGARQVGLQVQSGLSTLDLAELKSRTRSGDEKAGPLRILVASRMVFWKGVDLAIEAVARARAQGLECVVEISENGPEEGRLRALVARLGLEDHVTFLGRLPGHDDLLKTLSSSDVLLHPAISESFGQVCLEALACGVPVVCLDWGGPGIIVDDQCGYPVEAGTRDKVITGLADALMRRQQDRARGLPRPEVLHARAASFSWDRLVDSVKDAYASVNSPVS